MSAGEVTGVIRSTMLLGKATCASIQSASPGSLSRANAQIIRLATSPLSGRLSQLITVNGALPSVRRRSRAAVMNPKTVVGAAPPRKSAARSVWIEASAASNSPVTWLTR